MDKNPETSLFLSPEYKYDALYGPYLTTPYTICSTLPLPYQTFPAPTDAANYTE